MQSCGTLRRNLGSRHTYAICPTGDLKRPYQPLKVLKRDIPDELTYRALRVHALWCRAPKMQPPRHRPQLLGRAVQKLPEWPAELLPHPSAIPGAAERIHEQGVERHCVPARAAQLVDVVGGVLVDVDEQPVNAIKSAISQVGN
jgi:hypothetical protein